VQPEVKCDAGAAGAGAISLTPRPGAVGGEVEALPIGASTDRCRCVVAFRPGTSTRCIREVEAMPISVSTGRCGASRRYPRAAWRAKFGELGGEIVE
jgi:hypothetical protein